MIIKIEKQSLDSQAVNKVTEQFLNNKHFFLLSRDGGNFTDELGELENLQSKLTLALEYARSRFKLENRGILAKVFDGILRKVGKQ